VRAATWNWRGQHPFSRKGAPGLHGAFVIFTCMTLLPNPPLTTGSFLATIFFEDVAWLDCTAEIRARGGSTRSGIGESNVMTLRHSVHFSWWDKSDISPGADKIASARPAARVKAGRLAAPLCGVALTGRGSWRAKIGVDLVASTAWAEGGMGAIVSMSGAIQSDAALRQSIEGLANGVGDTQRRGVIGNS
jgi:hypothetical protein